MNFFCFIIIKEELNDVKEEVVDYVICCFKKEKQRIEKKVENRYFADIEKELDLFNRNFEELTNKEFRKWIRRFFEIIFIIEDDFYSFVNDRREDEIILEKLKSYYNEYYKKKYKEKNLHILTCPEKIYNQFAYAVAYDEYYPEIITKIKYINRINQ